MRIHASAQHLDGLIHGILDLASNPIDHRVWSASHDLRQALEVVLMIGQQMAQDKGLAWSTQIPESLPRVLGDRTASTRLHQTWSAMPSGFTSAGEVRLAAETAPGEVRCS